MTGHVGLEVIILIYPSLIFFSFFFFPFFLTSLLYTGISLPLALAFKAQRLILVVSSLRSCKHMI